MPLKFALYREVMVESLLQQQLDEVRSMLQRARELFGTNLIEPPASIAPNPTTVQNWVH